MRTKELEVQYHLARYEDEKSKVDEEVGKVRSLQSQVQTFHKTETELRQQLNVYIDKFKQVSRRCGDVWVVASRATFFFLCRFLQF